MTVQIQVQLKEEDVDDIMVGSLEGGCTQYWCDRVDVKGIPRQEYASQEIARGGTLIFHDCEGEKTYELDLEKFLNGFKIWVEKDTTDIMQYLQQRLTVAILMRNVQMALFNALYLAISSTDKERI